MAPGSKMVVVKKGLSVKRTKSASGGGVIVALLIDVSSATKEKVA